MITPKDKDMIVAAIVAEPHSMFHLAYKDVFPDGCVSDDDFDLTLLQFKEKGLLSSVSIMTGGLAYIGKSANIYDFYSHGGFIAQEEILRANLEKLDYELMKLSCDIDPRFSSRVERITGIAAYVATALSLFR